MHSEDGLNFYRKDPPSHDTPSSVDPVEVVVEFKPRKKRVKQIVGAKIKVGKSVYREHLAKEAKLKEVRDFLKEAKPHCCLHREGLCRVGKSTSFIHNPDNILWAGEKTSCFEAFSTVKDQETSIRDLRMKYFGPYVSKKNRRPLLTQEMLGMVEVDSKTGDRVVKFKINQKNVCE